MTPLAQLWLTAGTIIVLLAFLAHNPTLKILQQRIIVLRAAYMTVGLMWREAWKWGRYVFPEMLHKAKHDA